MKFQFEGSVAVVTGAAQGIGAALAMELAARKCHLALIDHDAEQLSATAQRIKATGLRVSEHPVDMADARAVAALPENVLALHPQINLVINNAGVGLLGSFEQLTLEEFEWLMDINFWGMVRASKAFLPYLMRQPNAHLANISSVFGLIAPIEQSAYVASKFAVRGFTDALRHEMEGTTVGVSVILPGGIKTRIAHNSRRAQSYDPAKAERLAERFFNEVRTTPAQAAACIANGIEQRLPRILIGKDARLLDWMSRLAPVGYWRLIRHLFLDRLAPSTTPEASDRREGSPDG